MVQVFHGKAVSRRELNMVRTAKGRHTVCLTGAFERLWEVGPWDATHSGERELLGYVVSELSLHALRASGPR